MMYGWGVIRYGDRFVLLKRCPDGVFQAPAKLHQWGDRLREGPLADVLRWAVSYETEGAAFAAHDRWHLRQRLTRDDRWTHLDVLRPPAP